MSAAISPAVGLLLSLLAVVGVISAVLAARNRLPFRIAMRNVRRGRARTVLLILGLLVGTTIISGSLVINDTVTAVNQHFTLQSWGFTDEAIDNETPGGGLQPFSLAVFNQINASMAGNPLVAGLSPEIVSSGSAYDVNRGVPETNLDVVGVNGNQSTALGPFTTDGGATLPGPAPGHALLDDQAALQLNASVGDRLFVFGHGSTPVPVTVQAIVKDDTRGGFFFLFAGQAGNVFLDLAAAQAAQGLPSNAINFVAVTNTGSQLDGVANSDSVSGQLNATLARIGQAASLKVTEPLKDGLSASAKSGANTATIFFVLGLFSIVAGGMLVVGIFVMLAEERLGEMGTIRAIGLRRRSLVLIFFFEGLAYAAGSALAGTFVGVGVGYGLTYAFSIFLSSGAVTASAILQSFTVTTQSLLIAYVAGFLLTLVTVAVASARASRLNIVRAIRSIPAPPPTLRLYTWLAYLGIPVLLGGLLLFLATYQGTTDISLPSIGGDMVILGIGLIGSRFLKNRVIFTIAAVGLLVWNGVEPFRHLLLGNNHTGSIFVVFTLGIFLILGAVLIFLFDGDYAVNGLTRILGRTPRQAAIVRVGLSYPSRRPTRPAITLTIFTLVIFTVVVVAVFAASLETNLNDSIGAQSGNYSFFGTATLPIPTLASDIRSNSSLSPQIAAVVPLIGAAAEVNNSSWGREWWGFVDAIHSAPTNLSGASDFYATNGFTFSATAGGADARATWADVETHPGDVVVDGSYNGPGSFGVGGPHPILTVGSQVSIVNGVTGASANLTVIGVMTGSLLGGVWLNPSEASLLGFSAITDSLITVAAGTSHVHAAQSLKSAFFSQGLVLFDFDQILASTIQSFQAVIGLLEIFVALGLGVGIAAMGIVALRAVVERRREIGMLRAGGFRRSHIFATFFLEYSYVSLLGIFAGTVLGILLVYEAAATGSNGLTFTIPWTTIWLVVGVAYGLTILAIVGPSIRAARLPPSEAVRYTE
ncbi:MAG TPA: FtsX-like permease family protein [Thermoplasmata archaeon]|nr:FtsX-like permease family protein [Thermoplasmata archaeon]